MNRPLHLCAALSLAALLAACGGGGDDNASDEPVTVDPTPVDPAPVDPAPVDPAPVEPPPRPQPQGRATDRGAPLGAAVAFTIGVEGGELRSADGRFSVSVPPGALAQPTAIAIQAVNGEAHGAVGAAYRLTPADLTPAADVTLRWHYRDSDLIGTHPNWLGVATQDAQGSWRRMRTDHHDTAARTVSLRTRQFAGDWAPVSSAMLLPRDARVRVRESQGFAVRVCEQAAIDAPDSAAVAALMHCDDRPLDTVSANGWQVNGQAGGNAAVGTVAPAGAAGATYTAPARMPGSGAATVSTVVRLPGSGTDDLVTLPLTVFDDTPPRCAGLVDANVINATVSLSYAFAGTNSRGDTLSFDHDFEVTAQLKRIVESGDSIDFHAHELGGIVSTDDHERQVGWTHPASFKGSSAPWGDHESFSWMTLSVDPQACTYRFSVEPIVRAVHTQNGSSDPNGWGQLGLLTIGTRDAGPATGLIEGAATVPAVWGVGLDEEYFPQGMGAGEFARYYTGSAAQAQARWTLRPQP